MGASGASEGCVAACSALSTAAQTEVMGGRVAGLTWGVLVTMTDGRGGHSGSVASVDSVVASSSSRPCGR